VILEVYSLPARPHYHFILKNAIPKWNGIADNKKYIKKYYLVKLFSVLSFSRQDILFYPQAYHLAYNGK